MLPKKQERNIVASLSQGNLSLQLGRYLTKADIEQQRKGIIAREKKRQSFFRRLLSAC